MSLDSLTPLPLELKTPAAVALQAAVQDELAARSWAPADDAVMAEYTVVMVANRKTGPQVAEELSDLVGSSDFDPNFVVWLWNATVAVLQGQTPQSSSSNAVSTEAPPSAPVAHPAPSSFDYQRSRSRSPGGHRGGSPEGRYGGGRGAQERSYRGLPARPPKELFQAAVQGATAPAPTRGRAHARVTAEDEMDYVLGFEDRKTASDSEPRTSTRGLREKGELFPQSPSARDLSIRGRAGRKQNPDTNNNKASIFARTGTPNPNMPIFQPRQQEDLSNSQAGQGSRAGHPWETGTEATSLLSRLGPQSESRPVPAGAIVAPAPAGLDINSVDVRQFPWEPSNDASCRFGLRCTNPMCTYSHSTPVLANSPKEGDAMMLSTTHCSAGPKCLNTECSLSHPSPAVSILATRAQAAARAQLARARLVAATGGLSAPTTSGARQPCRFQQACTNPHCSFAHFDSQGAPVPPPAQQAAQGQEGMSVDPTPPIDSSPSEATAVSGLDKPLDDTSNAKPCRFGVRCTRPGCFFSHPPGRIEPRANPIWGNKPTSWVNHGSNSAVFNADGASQPRTEVQCKFGAQCYRAGCAFAHPPERELPQPPQSKPATSERLAGFAGPRDPHDVERIIPSTS